MRRCQQKKTCSCKASFHYLAEKGATPATDVGQRLPASLQNDMLQDRGRRVRIDRVKKSGATGSRCVAPAVNYLSTNPVRCRATALFVHDLVGCNCLSF